MSLTNASITFDLDGYSPGGDISWGTDQTGWTGGMLVTDLLNDLRPGDGFETLTIYINRPGSGREIYRQFHNIEIAAERLVDYQYDYSGQRINTHGIEFTWRQID